MTKRLILFAVAALFTFPARAQFQLDGNEPGKLHWSTIQTPSYRLVYPEGMDSLAREFAFSLEKFRLPVAASCGFVPNEAYTKKMPVVLHPYSAYSNGMVAWAPRRMTLMSVPDAYKPEGLNWIDLLSVHESRHVAQMQFIKSTRAFRFMHGLLGEMWAGGAAAMYMGPTMLEGDAVAAETGLLTGGRGHTADFMEYMHTSLSQGRYRDYWQWTYGSQKRYTPDYYRAGYLLVAGMRNSFDRADFIPYYYRRIARKKLPLFNLQKSVRELSGKKFRAAFTQIQDDFASSWAGNEAARGPFIEGRELTPIPRLYEEFYSLCHTDTTMTALHRGLARNPELVELFADGSYRHLQYFSGTTSRLAYSPGSKRLYWTEHKADSRWGAVSYSVLRYRDPSGKTRTLAGGKRYYNPAPNPEKHLLAVTEYPAGGGSKVLVLDEEDGQEVEVFTAPDYLSAVETVWLDGQLYASAVSGEGSGIYALPDWQTVLEPVQAKINHLFAKDGRIWLTSDMDGVNELYSLDLARGSFWKETSTRFGGNDFVFAGDSLYFSSPGTEARGVRVLGADSLLGEEAAVRDAYPIAALLTSQESIQADPEIEVEISRPEAYNKLRHLLHFHSWAPVFLDLDMVSSYSYEQTTMDANLGAMTFFQNELSNSYGYAGVGLIDEQLHFRPSLHMQYAYTGFLPVLEFRLDVNDRENNHHTLSYDGEINGYVPGILAGGKPAVNLSFVSYMPFSLSSGGWSRGIVPMIKAAFTNEIFDFLDLDNGSLFKGTLYGASFLNAEVRAYTMLPATSSKIYPHLGMGAKLGVSINPFISSQYGNKAYCGLYGYLPGLIKTHGVHLDLGWDKVFGSDFVSGDTMKLQADYALPFGAVDWSGLSPLIYLRNFELRGHLELLRSITRNIPLGEKTVFDRGSAGASLAMHLGNLLWLPYDTLLGVKYIYCFTEPALSAASLVFSIDI